jgi:chromosome segregation ATPase
MEDVNRIDEQMVSYMLDQRHPSELNNIYDRWFCDYVRRDGSTPRDIWRLIPFPPTVKKHIETDIGKPPLSWGNDFDAQVDSTKPFNKDARRVHELYSNLCKLYHIHTDRNTSSIQNIASAILNGTPQHNNQYWEDHSPSPQHTLSPLPSRTTSDVFNFSDDSDDDESYEQMKKHAMDIIQNRIVDVEMKDAHDNDDPMIIDAGHESDQISWPDISDDETVSVVSYSKPYTPSLIINVPNRNTYEIIHRIMRSLPHIPTPIDFSTLFPSTIDIQRIQDQARDQGNIAGLPKDPGAEEMDNQIQNLLEKIKTVRDRRPIESSIDVYNQMRDELTSELGDGKVLFMIDHWIDNVLKPIMAILSEEDVLWYYDNPIQPSNVNSGDSNFKRMRKKFGSELFHDDDDGEDDDGDQPSDGLVKIGVILSDSDHAKKKSRPTQSNLSSLLYQLNNAVAIRHMIGGIMQPGVQASVTQPSVDLGNIERILDQRLGQEKIILTRDTELAESLDKLRNSNTELKILNNQLKEDQTKLKESQIAIIIDLQKEVKSNIDQLGTKDETITRNMNEIETLKSELEKLNENDTNIKSLRNKIKELTDQIENLSQLSDKNTKLQIFINSLQDEIANLQSNEQTNLNTIKDLNANIKELSEELGSQSNTSLREEVKKQGIIDKLNASNKALKVDSDNLRNELIKVRKQLVEKTQEISTIIEEFNSSKNLIDNQDLQNSKRVSDLQALISQGTSELTTTTDNLKGVRNELKRVQDAKKEVENRINLIDSERKRLRSENLKLKNQSKKSSREIIELKNNLTNAKKKVQQQESLVSQLSSKISQSGSSNTRLQGELETAKQELNNSMYKIGNINAQLQNAILENRSMRKIINSAAIATQSTINQLNKKIGQLQSQVQTSDRTTEINTLKARAVKLEADLRISQETLNTRNQQIQNIQARLQSNQAKISQLTIESSSKLSKEQADQLSTNINNLKKQNQDLLARIKGLNSANRQLITGNNTLKGQNAQLEVNNVNNGLKIRELEATIKENNANINQLQSTNQDLSAQSSRNDTRSQLTIQENQDRINQLEEQNQNSVNVISSLKPQLLDAEVKIGELERLLRENKQLIIEQYKALVPNSPINLETFDEQSDTIIPIIFNTLKNLRGLVDKYKLNDVNEFINYITKLTKERDQFSGNNEDLNYIGKKLFSDDNFSIKSNDDIKMIKDRAVELLNSSKAWEDFSNLLITKLQEIGLVVFGDDSVEVNANNAVIQAEKIKAQIIETSGNSILYLGIINEAINQLKLSRPNLDVNLSNFTDTMKAYINFNKKEITRLINELKRSTGSTSTLQININELQAKNIVLTQNISDADELKRQITDMTVNISTINGQLETAVTGGQQLKQEKDIIEQEIKILKLQLKELIGVGDDSRKRKRIRMTITRDDIKYNEYVNKLMDDFITDTEFKLNLNNSENIIRNKIEDFVMKNNLEQEWNILKMKLVNEIEITQLRILDSKFTNETRQQPLLNTNVLQRQTTTPNLQFIQKSSQSTFADELPDYITESLQKNQDKESEKQTNYHALMTFETTASRLSANELNKAHALAFVKLLIKPRIDFLIQTSIGLFIRESKMKKSNVIKNLLSSSSKYIPFQKLFVKTVYTLWGKLNFERNLVTSKTYKPVTYIKWYGKRTQQLIKEIRTVIGAYAKETFKLEDGRYIGENFDTPVDFSLGRPMLTTRRNTRPKTSTQSTSQASAAPLPSQGDVSSIFNRNPLTKQEREYLDGPIAFESRFSDEPPVYRGGNKNRGRTLNVRSGGKTKRYKLSMPFFRRKTR